MFEKDSPGLDDVFALVLGGGRGSRLYPLTEQRSEPAVPIGGKYRLIDIPISNCVNSGIFRIAILTQYNSVSLHRHIARAYKFDAFHPGSVEIWAAEQTIANAGWYMGTADAIRKRLPEIRNSEASYILILAGDHLYRMDYAVLAQARWETQADIIIAVHPISRQDASRLGLLKCSISNKDTAKLPRENNTTKNDAAAKTNSALRVTSFVEKPTDPAVLENFICRDDAAKPYMGSMGIYLFKTQVLIDLLEQTTFTDFGAQIIPYALEQNYALYSYNFTGYWEDIGTIRSYYDTHLQLTHPDPPFNFNDPEHPIYSHSSLLPSSLIENSLLEEVLLCEGCIIQGAEINHSVIGLRTQIGKDVRITNSVLIGADFYVHPLDTDVNYCAKEINAEVHIQHPPVGIGNGSIIDGAIIDKNARIGEDVLIRPFQRGTSFEGAGFTVQDGIVVVHKDAIIPDGTKIAP